MRFSLVAALGLALAAPAGALSLSGSTLTLEVGGLPPAVFSQAPDRVSVAGTPSSFVLPASVFAGTFIPSKSFFTGVDLISSLSISATNGPLSWSGGPGAVGRLDGTAILGIFGGLIQVHIPLTVVGQAGTNTSLVVAATLIIQVTGMSWTTGTGQITGLPTQTPMGAIVNTFFVTGSDNRTPGGLGTLTLVSPARVLTNAAVNLTAAASMSLRFVPEPGSLLLFAAGMAALLLAGHRRKR